MKNEVNRAFMAKKKTYQIPSVELTQLAMSSLVMAGSGAPGIGIGDPISGGVGG